MLIFNNDKACLKKCNLLLNYANRLLPNADQYQYQPQGPGMCPLHRAKCSNDECQNVLCRECFQKYDICPYCFKKCRQQLLHNSILDSSTLLPDLSKMILNYEKA